MAERLKGVNHTVSRLKAADFLLLPPFRGKVGMGVSGDGSCRPWTLHPLPRPPPFRGRGICFAAIARVEPRGVLRRSRGCLKLNYRNIVNLAARVVLRMQLLQALARHLRINLGC